MAFNRNSSNATARVASFPGNEQSNARRADGFINIMFPRRNGDRAKLGFLTLSMSKEIESEILEYLTQHGEAGMQAIKDRMIFQFNPVASAKADSGLDLPPPPPVTDDGAKDEAAPF